MTEKLPELTIHFSYDHVSGNFFGRLDNGSVFEVKRSNVSGKLENALSLFRGAIITLLEGRKPFKKISGDFGQLEELIKNFPEERIQKAGKIENDLLDF